MRLDAFLTDSEPRPYPRFAMTKTSISLPDDVAAELARRGPSARRRSAIVATALRTFFSARSRARGDSAILKTHAAELNEEAQDVLEFQNIP